MTQAVTTPMPGRYGLGGSDLASAAGLHPYKPRIVLWRELTGDLPPFEGNQRTRWGTLLEPVVRQEYVERHDVAVMVPQESLYHHDQEWARATPDGIVVHEGQWLYGLEIKTAGAQTAHQWGEAGSDEVPGHYVVQCAHYMAVTGLDRWDLAVLIGGSDYREYRIQRDQEFIDMLWAEGAAFWGHVINREPPPVDASAEYGEYLRDRYPHLRDELKPADSIASENLEQLRSVTGRLRELEIAKKGLLNHLRAFAGDCRGVESSAGKLTWSKVSRPTIDYAAICRTVIPRDQLAELEAQHSRVTTYERANYPRSWGKQ